VEHADYRQRKIGQWVRLGWRHMTHLNIDSLDDPRISFYRDLNTTKLADSSGRFIAEGWRLVERVLKSRYPVESLLVADDYRERVGPHVPADVPMYVAPRHMLSETLGFKFHRGVLACAFRRPGPTVDEILARLSADQPATVVVCPEIQDPENLGTVIRNSAAFGVDALLIGPGSADPFGRRVLRVSMGSVFELPVAESGDLMGLVDTLAERGGFERIAAVLSGSARPLHSLVRPRRLVLLFGNEAVGLSDEWLRHSDQLATIAMRRGTDSLNVGVAAGVFLYHFSER
jgi:tRNA G18 (ribose-2'-O)-methylase SpoU